jgi:hypothetical protein
MLTDRNRKGLRLIRREPALFAMELLWRWSFGLGVLALLVFAYAQLRPAVILSPGDEAALAGHDPFAIAETVSRLAADLAPLLVRTLLELCAPVAVLWILAFSLGRGLVTRSIMRRIAADSVVSVAPDSRRWIGFATLTAARLLMLLILVIGYLGGGFLAAMADPDGQQIGLPAAIVLLSLVLAGWLWSRVDGVLALAPILLVRDGLRPLDAIVAAMGFLDRNRLRLREIARRSRAIRGAAALIITVLSILTAFLPASALVVGILLALETMAYLLVADLFHLARLAACAAVAVGELAPPQPATALPGNHSGINPS